MGAIAFRVPKADTPAAAAVKLAVDALDTLEDVYRRVHGDRELSAEGRRRRVEPVQRQAVADIDTAAKRVEALRSARQDQLAALYAIPPAKDAADVMLDIELRSRYGALPEKTQNTARTNERVQLALARDPYDVPSAVVAREAWYARVQEQNPGRVAELAEREAQEELATIAIEAVRKVVVQAGQTLLVRLTGQDADEAARRQVDDAIVAAMVGRE
jgi:hypothetical protein